MGGGRDGGNCIGGGVGEGEEGEEGEKRKKEKRWRWREGEEGVPVEVLGLASVLNTLVGKHAFGLPHTIKGPAPKTGPITRLKLH